MLVREAVYYLMSDKMLDKRIERLGAKIQTEVDPRVKIEILGDITDIVKAIIRKNRHNKRMLRNIGNELEELLEESEAQMEMSRN